MKQKKLGKVERTERGFELVNFTDCNGNPCGLQASSLAIYEKPGTSAVWLGQDDHRMHLNREQVAALVAALQSWLKRDTFKIK